MAEFTLPSLIFLIVSFFAFFLLYSSGKKKYMPFIEPLDKETFRLKEFFPAGFMLMDLVRYSYSSGFDRSLRRKIPELYDVEFTEFYLRVYWAAAATYLVLGIFATALFTFAASGDMMIMILGFVVTAVLIYANFADVEKKVKHRHLLISLDIPDLTNRIIILSGAGLTLKGALLKIARETEIDRPLYRELSHVATMMENGEADEVVFDRLNMRCNMLEMRRFTSIILQNINRGGSDAVTIFQDIGREMWDQRKAMSKRLAEEATTKMLYPMMLMLLAVIMLTVAPAVMSMNI